MANEDSSAFLRKVYSADDNRELAAVYDQWAGRYDAHVTAFGYRIPAVAAGLFGRHVPRDIAPILDAGAGTGLMGAVLHALGYRGQVGIDLSAGMLERARQRGVYAQLRQMVLGERLDFPDDHFGACQSIGVFTAGHAPAAAFGELVRVVRPGGRIVFSLREDTAAPKGYLPMLQALEEDGRWLAVEKTVPFAGLPLEDPEMRHRVYVFRVQ